MAHCKTDQPEIIGLVVQASPEIILLCCVLYNLLCLVLADSTHETVRYDRKYLTAKENR